MTIRVTRSIRCLAVLFYLCLAAPSFAWLKGYRGQPFADSVYSGGPQKIPGKVQCAYYDLGGEGVAYHDTDPVNHGSGELNPANGTYLNEFRMKEGFDTSYVKHNDGVNHTVQIDDSPYGKVIPPAGQLYVGWILPGEWFNMTVEVARAGEYSIDLLYTSNRGGTISLDLDGKKLTGAIDIPTTFNPEETVEWRQWHHWNLLNDMATVKLPKGKHVLTFRVLTEGNMNYAYLDFKEKAKAPKN